MNKWGIPFWLEQEVIARDTTCVYCRVEMTNKITQDGLRKTVATWEHIINDASIITSENIARCCSSCNSSKGTKNLQDWLKSDYCKIHAINKDTVAEVVKGALTKASNVDVSTKK